MNIYRRNDPEIYPNCELVVNISRTTFQMHAKTKYNIKLQFCYPITLFLELSVSQANINDIRQKP